MEGTRWIRRRNRSRSTYVAPGRFTLCGELDMTTAPQLAKLEDDEGPLLLDLRDVSFLDSRGVAGLLRLYRRCERDGCAFLIEWCSQPANAVLRIVGLYEIFTEDGARHGPGLPSLAVPGEPGAAASD